jgi:hypothetical protein
MCLFRFILEHFSLIRYNLLKDKFEKDVLRYGKENYCWSGKSDKGKRRAD